VLLGRSTSAMEIDCRGELSHKKRSICQAISTERASLIIDSDRQQLPYPISGYSSPMSVNGNHLVQSQWRDHPNWPSQTLLIYDHRHFRGTSQDIVSGIYEIFEHYLQTKKILKTLRSLKIRILQILQNYQEELINHARYAPFHLLSSFCWRCEEARLFPLMKERYWKDNELDTLTSQHLLLDQRIQTLHEMLQNLSEDSDGEDLRLLLVTAIEADEILLHHLGNFRPSSLSCCCSSHPLVL
jgi:hypothetical protein